jgi:enoyl-CoA hydratase/carnithine racemase
MESVVLEKKLNKIALITLNRPEAKNALNLELRQRLGEIFSRLTLDEDIRAVVLTGGDVFAAGADIKDMVELSAGDMMKRASERYWQPIVDFPKPLIAAVNGFALGGGCELAMHADMIIAGEGAKFGQPEVKLGIMPGAGGTQRLLRAVGKFHGMRLLLTGDIISAAEALGMGLVTQVVPDHMTIETAMAMAEKIALLPPIAVQQIKEIALLGADLPLNSALNLERKAFQLLFDTADKKEGMQAFIEKRKPVFKGQ